MIFTSSARRSCALIYCLLITNGFAGNIRRQGELASYFSNFTSSEPLAQHDQSVFAHAIPGTASAIRSIDPPGSINSSFRGSPSSPMCAVYVPQVTEYRWYIDVSQTTSIETNTAGVCVKTLELTTGGYEQDGHWVHQTTTTIL